MKKFLWLFILLLGCSGSEKGFYVSQIDQQIILLRNHIVDITDSEGAYQNENIDLLLMKKIKENTIDKAQNNIDLWQTGKIDNETMDETINKMLSVLYFVWMEELDSALTNYDSAKLKALQAEHDRITADETIQSWLTKNEKINYYADIREIFTKVLELVLMKEKIDKQNSELTALKAELENLKNENQVSDYNDRVEFYNNKVLENEKLTADYNAGIGEFNNEYIYKTFIKIIDINILFPNQDSIELIK